WIKQTLDAEKDVLYRFVNDSRLRWRSIVYGISCKLINCIDIKNPSNACLILDDTDLKKTGVAMELVSRVWSHVEGKAVLGFKGLFLGWCDEKSSLILDFSMHREGGKNEKTPFGLKPKQLKNQFHKDRPSNSAGAKRVLEADQKKTDVGMSMIRRAISRGISFGYVLMDSWFVNGKMIRFILSLPGGKHLLGMGKMNGTKYKFQDKEFTAKELCDRLSRKKKGKRNRSLHMVCIQVNVFLQEEPVCLFFYRNTKKGPWHFLVSTDMELTPLKAYQLYAKRWNIEIYFKEAKRFFGLNDCHSRDFDALIAHTSVALIAYNMFSTAKRLNSYETLGDLFREVAGQMTELTLSERIWSVILELLKFVSNLFDIDFASLIQSLMQKGDPESKLLRIVNFCNARAA
ncbi:MAG: transposase, partial [Bacteroidales bacterium]